MVEINKQADGLNKIIIENNSAIYDLLSEKGRRIFFPKEGILAQTEEAKGKKINATIGIATHDDKKPLRLDSIASKILLEPEHVFPYASSYGKPELRKIWKEKIQEKNPSLKGRISLPVVTSGITHGLSLAGYMFVNPEDRIILPDKFWGNYRLIFEHSFGGVLDTFNTFKNRGLDLESFREKMKEGKGKKIILFNFPNNPTGYTPTHEEAEKTIKIIKDDAKRNEIVVICDDAYFGLVYKDGIYRESLFSKLADLDENVLAIKVDGATKEDYVWGLRVGFVTYASKGISEETCRALESKTAGAVRGSVSNVSHLSQSLLLEAFKSETHEHEKKEKYEFLRSRFEKVHEILKDKKYSEFFSVLPNNSGYFLCVELNGLDAEKIRQTLLEKYDTGVIATGDLLRITFSSVAENDMKQLFENIFDACQEQNFGGTE